MQKPLPNHKDRKSEAAKTVIIPEQQAHVLQLFQRMGPMSDEHMLRVYRASDYPTQSDSGLYARRRELTTKGLLYDSKSRGKDYRGYSSIIWEAADPETER